MSPELSEDPNSLLRSLVESATVAETIEQLTASAAGTFDTPYVGATLLHKGGKRFDTAGPTDPVVRSADDLQHTLREGPCIDAAVDSRAVFSNDLATDARWPRWGSRIAALGLTSIVSAEIHSGTGRIGALNIYGTGSRTFTPEDLDTARTLAGQAGVAVRVSERIEGLLVALDSRALVGQAQGILMGQYQLDEDRAFAVLRRLSQSGNTRLVTIAQQVVDGEIQL